MVFLKKVKSPLIVPYFVPYQHSLLLKLVLRALDNRELEVFSLNINHCSLQAALFKIRDSKP
jgi:hypothetical protein